MRLACELSDSDGVGYDTLVVNWVLETVAIKPEECLETRKANKMNLIQDDFMDIFAPDRRRKHKQQPPAAGLAGGGEGGGNNSGAPIALVAPLADRMPDQVEYCGELEHGIEDPLARDLLMILEQHGSDDAEVQELLRHVDDDAQLEERMEREHQEEEAREHEEIALELPRPACSSADPMPPSAGQVDQAQAAARPDPAGFDMAELLVGLGLRESTCSGNRFEFCTDDASSTPVGVVHTVGHGLKATCRAHAKDKCTLWVSSGIGRRSEVMRELLCWLRQGLHENCSEHRSSATAVKQQFGMKVRVQ